MIKFNPSKIKTKFNLAIILILLLTLIHFSFPPILTFDSGHYHSYLKFFDGQTSWSQWNLVRGLVFPFLIKTAHFIFGYNSQGILMFTFIFYLIFLFTCLKIITLVIKTKKAQIISYILFLILFIFDPIIIGYYHTILTEFVAATIMVFSCYVGLIWQKLNFYDKNKNKFIFYSLYFLIMTPISWHLKQPNVTTTLLPLLAVSILSILNKTTLYNFLQRIFIIIMSLITLYVSTIIWNNFITKQSNENYYQYTSNFAQETYGPRIWPHLKEKGVTQYLTENFLATINVYQYKREPEPKLYSISHNFSLNRTAQNAIGYSIFNFDINSGPSNLQVPSKYPYQGFINPYASLNAPTIFKSFIKSLISKSNFLFSFLFMISPLTLIFLFIKKIIQKNDLVKRKNLSEDIILVFSFIAFFQVFIHSIITEDLDRYVFPAYPLLLISTILFIVNIFNKHEK